MHTFGNRTRTYKVSDNKMIMIRLDELYNTLWMKI